LDSYVKIIERIALPDTYYAKMEASVAESTKSNESVDLIPTRQSLLSRLKDWSDQEGWKDFFDTYWKLIYCTAVKAGLNDAEAQDVVQETVISVMKSMPEFQYDRQKASFKGWLLQLTSWRIRDQLRKRGRFAQNVPLGSSAGEFPIQDIADPNTPTLELNWDKEWEQNLLEAAIERVKRKVDAKHYQIFDLLVVKGWSVLEVARTMKVNPGRVYLIKHRISKLIKKEIAYLQAKYT
jgi:RNA polymerase sigma factor (sigma-70 family)